MKTTINFPKGLVESQHNANVVSALFSIILFGVVLIVSHNILDFESDSLYSSLIMGGVIVAIVASVILSFSLKRSVLSSSESPLKCRVVEFNESEYVAIKEAATKGQWSQIKSHAQMGDGIAMKMEIVHSRDKGFAAYQFFRYVPHSYEACSEIIYLEKDALSALFKESV